MKDFLRFCDSRSPQTNADDPCNAGVALCAYAIALIACGHHKPHFERSRAGFLFHLPEFGRSRTVGLSRTSYLPGHEGLPPQVPGLTPEAAPVAFLAGRCGGVGGAGRDLGDAAFGRRRRLRLELLVHPPCKGVQEVQRSARCLGGPVPGRHNGDSHNRAIQIRSCCPTQKRGQRKSSRSAVKCAKSARLR